MRNPTGNGNCSVVGIAEDNKNHPEVEIYPDPFTSHTTISFNEKQKKTRIKLVDVLGKEIRKMYFTGKQLIMEKGEQQAGVYFIQIMDDNKNVVNKKLIIQ